jgi:hypothetical protein
MSMRLILAMPLAALLSVTISTPVVADAPPTARHETHKVGAYDVETTTWDYVAGNCRLHEDTARYTHLGTWVKNIRNISRTCGTRRYTYHSTLAAIANGRNHKDEQSMDNDPATCSSLIHTESDDFVRTQEITGQRTITKVLNGVAQTPSRAIYKNGQWVTVSGGGAAQSRSGGSMCLVTPVAGEDGGYGSGVTMLPPYAGSGSLIAVQLTPGEGGAQGVLVVTEDQQHNKNYQRHKPNNIGQILIDVAIGTAAVELVKRIDEHGSPNVLSHTAVGNPTHIPGTNVVANPSSSGPSILECTSSAQPGDVVTVHIARNDPLTTQFSLDGRQVTPLGVSDNSALFQIPVGTSLANHALVMESSGQQSNALNLAIVKLTPEPVAPSTPGVVQAVKVHVDGLAPGEQATMFFDVGGAATMLDGGTTASAPVINGVASVQIRGTHAGQALLRFHLSVKNPQFITGP